MRLLIINFEMDPNSEVLAWQLAVALGLAKLCDQVVVLTNRAGDFQRPDNMTLYIFPKVLFRAPFRWLGGKWWVNLMAWFICKKHQVSACFIHMNVEWCYRLAPAFAALNIPVLLWYAHGTVTDELRRAHHYATHVVTSTREGFRLPSDKLSIIGQGVDTSLFTIQDRVANATTIITVGRISQRKRIDLMIDVMDALSGLDPQVPFELVVIGGMLTAEDRLYQKQIVDKIAHSRVPGRIRLIGHVPMNEIPAYYRTAFLHLNLSLTGSMDKTVMEALAAGCPVLTSNEAFCEVLEDFPEFIAKSDHPLLIARQMHELFHRQASLDRQALRGLVVGKHDLPSYVSKLYQEIDDLIS